MNLKKMIHLYTEFRLFNIILDCTFTSINSTYITVYWSEAISLSRSKLCKLSFVYKTVTSQLNFTVRTEPKFGKYVVLLAFSIFSKCPFVCRIHS